MLDQATKKRIDDCRNILVGKITDPKSQVEQITIALIYKFMDDMDSEALEMGGVPTYFIGDYERYSWKSIYSPRIGGDEMLALYGEGMVKMHLNPNLPQLFRDIFKNAYLPYRDPETLRLFLRTINDFKYDHSERLGDAFEYLLSVLGSQGDAGQFRTPRHIIDFIVKIIDPKKNETICDPACGTSGFIISGFKHILQSNTNKVLGDKLTPEERRKLMTNISGYDISPDMVRLSLVNLFLHGFPNPKVYEYDTLTSEDRWNEYYDVILANPPFMSPKGGIRPHKRFGIESNRAEVLFVDYIMEHLTPKGRAGIVVPEGIIFQTGTAYKSLRKMLVEKYLIGVISLPSGVFQPYSGVKTSILILDRELSQKTDKIFFAKVENDGYDLGAQRREIGKNDLSELYEAIDSYIKNINHYRSDSNTILTLVNKGVVLSSNDIGLNRERYLENQLIKSNFEIVELGDVCEILRGGSPRPIQDYLTSSEEGENWIKIGDVAEGEKYITSTAEKITKEGCSKSRKVDVGDFILSNSMSFGRPYILKISGYIHDGWLLLKYQKDKIIEGYLYHILSSQLVYNQFKNKAVGGVVNNLNKELVKSVQIPLPPIEVQEEIVRELEQYQKIIDGAKQIVDNYKPVIDIDPSWEMKELGDVLKCIKNQIIPNELTGSLVNYVGLENIESHKGTLAGDIEANPKDIKSAKFVFEKGDILYGKLRPNLNKVLLSDFEGICSTDILVLRTLDTNSPFFYYSYLLDERFNKELLKGIKGAQLPRIDFNYMSKILIPCPPTDVQNSIANTISLEFKIIEGSKKLLELYTQKIHDRINKVWGN